MATLGQAISSLPADSGPKGTSWERLYQWFLLNDPVYASRLRRVWLFKDRSLQHSRGDSHPLTFRSGIVPTVRNG